MLSNLCACLSAYNDLLYKCNKFKNAAVLQRPSRLLLSSSTSSSSFMSKSVVYRCKMNWNKNSKHCFFSCTPLFIALRVVQCYFWRCCNKQHSYKVKHPYKHIRKMKKIICSQNLHNVIIFLDVSQGGRATGISSNQPTSRTNFWSEKPQCSRARLQHAQDGIYEFLKLMFNIIQIASSPSVVCI